MADWMRMRGLVPAGCRYGAVIHASPEIPSTQDPARDAAVAGEPGGALWVTDFQSAGRGRRGREWVGARGVDITFSLMIRPNIAAADTPLLSLAAAASVARAVSRDADGVAIKWPNDVLIDEKKFCGIICDSAADGSRLAWAVLGIGVNVNRPAELLPERAPDRPPSTSLVVATGVERDLPTLLAAILGELDGLVAMLEAGERERFIELYRSMCGTVGQRVRAFTEAGETEGTARGIGPDGELEVMTEGGLVSYRAEDVIHVKLWR